MPMPPWVDLRPKRWPAGAAFSPLSLDPALWLAADSGVSTDGARQYTVGNVEYHSLASNGTLQTGDVDFWVAFWAYLDSKSARRYMGGKWALASREWLLRYDNTSDRFQFDVGNGASSTVGSVEADSFGAPSTGTFIFVFAWHDSAANTVSVRINDGPPDSDATSGAVSVGTANMTIGRVDSDSATMDGRLARAAFGKSPPGGIASVISAISSSLYNSGTGKTYGDLTSDEKTDWGLVSYWNLNESSGNAIDQHGSNDLTDNNTVGAAAGPGLGQAVDEDPVARRDDQSGNNNHMLESTLASRPLLETSTDPHEIKYDGSDDRMIATSALTLKPATIFARIKPTNLSASRSILGADTANGLCLRIEATTGFLELLQRDGLSIGKSTTGLTAGSYNEIAATYDASGNFTFRVNGADAGSGTNDQTVAAAKPFIGSLDASTEFFLGSDQDVLLFESVLSSTQIANLEDYF